MTNLINTTETHYIFEGNNSYSRENYSLTQATELANTLVNCTGCIDCSNCNRCTDCIQCSECVASSDCYNCITTYNANACTGLSSYC